MTEQFCTRCGEPGEVGQHSLADCIHNVSLYDNRRALHLIADYVGTLRATWPVATRQYQALGDLVDAIHTLARTHPIREHRGTSPR